MNEGGLYDEDTDTHKDGGDEENEVLLDFLLHLIPHLDTLYKQPTVWVMF